MEVAWLSGDTGVQSQGMIGGENTRLHHWCAKSEAASLRAGRAGQHLGAPSAWALAAPGRHRMVRAAPRAGPAWAVGRGPLTSPGSRGRRTQRRMRGSVREASARSKARPGATLKDRPPGRTPPRSCTPCRAGCRPACAPYTFACHVCAAMPLVAPAAATGACGARALNAACQSWVAGVLSGAAAVAGMAQRHQALAAAAGSACATVVHHWGCGPAAPASPGLS